ncbi:adenylosuccinate synthase [Candidatus Micrarchaeota archaeon CG08_land_8_20_14_0_20_59_11]|nr:MAG: adenylosuccinate synthase [Candidatus Micrarchaeota archaeon CG08_land_8_20_14_0_20_59_11]
MACVIVVGAQWGDEGKGKVVDYYAEQADAVVRYSGGSNAGHTVIAGKKKAKLHLLPSGILHGKRVFVGAGVVLDPKTLLEEIAEIEKQGIPVKLVLSERAHVVLPIHRELDELQETAKGKLAAGTTKRGIGPCFSDKAARFGIRVAELIDEKAFKERLKTIYGLKSREIECVYGGKPKSTFEAVYGEYAEYGRLLKKYAGDVPLEVNRMLDDGESVLLEGTQGAMLDIDYGLYPFGSSSSVIAGGACSGAGVGPTRITDVVGVVKAYTSRVGEGPVPTELTGALADKIREKGGEYGTTTGRPRRIGWLDCVTLRHAIRINGITKLALTKADVLGGLKEVKICTSYELDGKKIEETPPASVAQFSACKPVYETMKCWPSMPEKEWRAACAAGTDALPIEFRAFLLRIAELARRPIALVSLGPDRADTLELKRVF